MKKYIILFLAVLFVILYVTKDVDASVGDGGSIAYMTMPVITWNDTGQCAKLHYPHQVDKTLNTLLEVECKGK